MMSSILLDVFLYVRATDESSVNLCCGALQLAPLFAGDVRCQKTENRKQRYMHVL